MNPIKEPWTIVQSIAINMAEYLKNNIKCKKEPFWFMISVCAYAGHVMEEESIGQNCSLCDSQEEEEKGEKEGGALRRRYSTPVMPPPYYLVSPS